jgi:MFS family permease
MKGMIAKRSPTRSPSVTAKGARTHGYFAVLSKRGFFLIWLGSILVTTADIAVGVTITWEIWEVTNSATAVGLLVSVLSVPRILLETVVGNLVDIFNRRTLMVVGASGLAAIAVVLAMLSGAGPDGRTAITVILVGVLPVASMTFARARSSLLPRLIADQATLIKAQALLQTTMEGLSFVAGAVALLIPVVGRKGLLLTAAVAALGAAGVAAGLADVDHGRQGAVARLPRRLLRGSVSEPLRAIRADRFLVWFLFIVATSNVPHKALTAMMAPAAAAKLGLGAQGYGAVEIATSVGVIAGFLLVGRLLAHADGPKLATVGLVWSGLAAILIGVSSGRAAIITFFAVYGLSEGFFLPAYSRYNLAVADDVRGRANAAFNVIALLMSPVAQIGAGLVVDHFGVSTLYVGSGLAVLGIAGVGYAMLVRDHRLSQGRKRNVG